MVRPSTQRSTAGNSRAAVTAEQIGANPGARFLDFLPPGATFFGEVSDGTIGPLGFAKMRVSSGEFERCMVRRLYERITGTPTVLSSDRPFIDSPVADFVNDNRSVRGFVRRVLAQETFRQGR